jgi:hypothetical protein
MPSELSRRPGPEVPAEELEYIEVPEHEHAIEAIGQALQIARDLSSKLGDAIPDEQRQRALRDLVAIVDNQLQEERAHLKDPSYKRQLRPADKQQFRRAFEYLNDDDSRTIDTAAE